MSDDGNHGVRRFHVTRHGSGPRGDALELVCTETAPSVVGSSAPAMTRTGERVLPMARTLIHADAVRGARA
jgi:hypothetical protein